MKMMIALAGHTPKDLIINKVERMVISTKLNLS